MKIDIYVAGASKTEGGLAGGAGIVLKFADELRRKQGREFYFWLGNSDYELASIQAARLGLASIVPAFRGSEVIVYTENSNVANLLTAAVEEGNKIVDDMKRWFGYYRDIDVSVVAASNKHLDRAKFLAGEAIELQRHYDSKTFTGD